MRLSQYFLPLIKETPSEATIPSHRLMLKAGLVRQVSSGIYTWLPMGLRVLRKVENIIREEMNVAGALEVLMPTMQPQELWDESGRGGYGEETLKAIDRHKRTLIYGPTHEEVITDLFRKHVRSYKELPMNLYQIQWKFRDEIRPRFGVMRGREFLMKDAYTFAETEEQHNQLYDTMYLTYFRIFDRMGLNVVPLRADTGLIGGNLSHEFCVVAETGESEIYYDAAFDEALSQDFLDINKLKNLYSAADEKHDPATCGVPPERLKKARGIEVGHIFYFDDKYSKPMKANIVNSKGEEVPVKMGAHGIGVSRLVGAIIESSHDENGIVWPPSVSPFLLGLINLKPGDNKCDEICNKVYYNAYRDGADVLYDDTDARAGEKFARMDLIGVPIQIIVGPKNAEEGNVEIKNRATGERRTVSIDSLLSGQVTG